MVCWQVQTHCKSLEFDSEAGLYNYDARLYDPVIGRFITPDSIVPQFFNPQSLNRYSYCLNNPLIYVDPSGHFEWSEDDYDLADDYYDGGFDDGFEWSDCPEFAPDDYYDAFYGVANNDFSIGDIPIIGPIIEWLSAVVSFAFETIAGIAQTIVGVVEAIVGIVI